MFYVPIFIFLGANLDDIPKILQELSDEENDILDYIKSDDNVFWTF